MSAALNQVAAAFTQTLAVCGQDITFNNTTKKQAVITGSIELARVPELAGDLPTYGTQATMLSTDLKSLGIDIRSRVTIAGIRMIVMKLDKDPVDPMTDFILVNEK